MKILTLYLFSVLLFGTADAQKKITPACDLSLADLPSLNMRGFTLGQSATEIGKRNPGFWTEYNDPRSRGGAYDRINGTDFRIIFLGGWAKDVDLDGAELILHFSDGKIKAIFGNYADFKALNLRDVINQTSQAMQVPSKAFKITGRHVAKLTCSDFSVEVAHGMESKVGWDSDGARIVLDDTVEEARLTKLYNEYKAAQRRQAEKERREEQKRRRTLRP